jgi:hypothetical protein
MKFLAISAAMLFPLLASASGTGVGNGRAACREGSIESFNESHGEGEPSVTTMFRCQGGRLVQIAPAPPQMSAEPGCREGDHEHWSTETANGLVSADYICHQGRYVLVPNQ